MSCSDGQKQFKETTLRAALRVVRLGSGLAGRTGRPNGEPQKNLHQVAIGSSPVAMTELLVSSLTGDRAIAEAAPALVVRVENIYEAGGEYFTVDAKARWSSEPFAVTVRDDPDQCPRYVVAGYVAHMRGEGVDALQQMRSGHYIAYVYCGGVWFEMDDAKVISLIEPPTRFPYLVFLQRADRKRMRGKQPAGWGVAAAM